MALSQLPDDFKEFIGDTELSVISKADLVKNKKATGRHGDLADVQALIEPDAD